MTLKFLKKFEREKKKFIKKSYLGTDESDKRACIKEFSNCKKSELLRYIHSLIQSDEENFYFAYHLFEKLNENRQMH